jgi:hypothetical protein
MAEFSKEFVIRKMRESRFPFFTVKDSDNKSIIWDQQDPDVSEAKAVEQLEEVLNEAQGSFLFVSIKGKTKAQLGSGGNTKGAESKGLEYKVKIDGQMNGVSGNRTDSSEHYKTIAGLEHKLLEMQYNQKYEALERKIEDLKKEDNNPMMEKAFQMLLPHLMPGAGAALPAPALAGPPTDQGNSEQERLRAALRRLSAVDPHFVDTLCYLADFAENKPDIYASYIPMLKNLAS